MQKDKNNCVYANCDIIHIASTDWISDFKLRRRPTYKSKIDRQTDKQAADRKR